MSFIARFLSSFFQKNKFDPEIQVKLNLIADTAFKLQGLIAKKTQQAKEEIVKKSSERISITNKKNSKREAQKKRADDTADANEQELQRETCALIQDMKSKAAKEGISEFGKAVLDVLNNYQVAINTVRSMSKNMYDGLFFLTNDVRSLEQNQSVIISRLDKLDAKVI